MRDVFVDVAVGRPSAVLAPFVQRFIGYRLEGFAPGVHRGLPSRQLSFIVSFDKPVDMLALPDPRQPPAAMDAFVGGLHTRAALLGHDGNQHGLAVELLEHDLRSRSRQRIHATSLAGVGQY